MIEANEFEMPAKRNDDGKWKMNFDAQTLRRRNELHTRDDCAWNPYHEMFMLELNEKSFNQYYTNTHIMPSFS